MPRSAVPVAEDTVVPPDKLADFLEHAAKICVGARVIPAFWGQAGNGIVRMRPVLDLAQTGDRQKLFKLSNELYGAAASLGGSITAAAGDGRIRVPYVVSLHGTEFQKLILQVKNIFDPHGLLNPGVKTASADDIKKLLRNEYSFGHHDHMPRS